MARHAEDILYRLLLAGDDLEVILNGYADAADHAHDALAKLIDTGEGMGSGIADGAETSIAALDDLTAAADTAGEALAGVEDGAAGASDPLADAAVGAAGAAAGLGALAGNGSRAATGLGGLASAVRLVSPETAKLMRGTSGLIRGLKALAPVGGAATGMLAGLSAAAAPVAVVLAAIGTVAVVVANQTGEARAEMAAFEAVLAKTDETTRKLIDSQNALKLASGDVAGFTANLKQQIALLNGEITDADLKAGQLGGQLADVSGEEIKAAADAWAESTVALQKLQAVMNDPEASRGDRRSARDAFVQLKEETEQLGDNLQALKDDAADARTAIDDYTEALEKAAEAGNDTPPALLTRTIAATDEARQEIDALIVSVAQLTAPSLSRQDQLIATLAELETAAQGSQEAAASLAPAITDIADALDQLHADEAAAALDALADAAERFTQPELTELEEMETLLARMVVEASEGTDAYDRLIGSIVALQGAIDAEKLEAEAAALEAVRVGLVAVQVELAATEQRLLGLAGAVGVGDFAIAFDALRTLRDAFGDAGDWLREGLNLEGLRDHFSELADGFRGALQEALPGLSDKIGEVTGGNGLLGAASSIPEPVTQAIGAVLNVAGQIGAAGASLEAELARAKASGDEDRVGEIEAAIAQYGSASGAAVGAALEKNFDNLIAGLDALPSVLGEVVIPGLIRAAPRILGGLVKALLTLPFEIAGAIFSGIGDIFEEGLGNALRRWWEGIWDRLEAFLNGLIHPFQSEAKKDGKVDEQAILDAQAEADRRREEAESSQLFGSSTSSARTSADRLRLRSLHGLMLPGEESEPGGGLSIAELNRAAGGGARRAMANRQGGGDRGSSLSVTFNTDVLDPDVARRQVRRLSDAQDARRRSMSGPAIQGA